MSNDRTGEYRYSTAIASERPPSTFWRRFVFTLGALAFVLGGLFSGYLFVARLRGVVGPPNVALPPADGVVRDLANLVRNLPLPLGQARTGPADAAGSAAQRTSARVNILLLGVDQRPNEGSQATRADSMIVVTIDPATNSAGILSIERDLWVPIPLDERNPLENKINTAHFFGDWYKYGGGGPALAVKTVEKNFGLKIDHYVKINFAGFRQLVDALGGIDVDVPTPLYDDSYPTDDGDGVMAVRFAAGRQHLNGERALQYARTRNPDSDFGRMQRQRQVLLAVRDRALQLDVAPRLPQLAAQYRDAVKTDMSVADMVALARLVQEIDGDKIVSRAIEGDALRPGRSVQGADIQLPVWPEIEKILAEVFPDTRLQEENARVQVLNGAGVAGLAARSAALLQSRGFKRVSIGDVDDGKEYVGIRIVDFSGKRYTSQRLAQVLGVPPERIESRRDPAATVDVRVILGKGAKLP